MVQSVTTLREHTALSRFANYLLGEINKYKLLVYLTTTDDIALVTACNADDSA